MTFSDFDPTRTPGVATPLPDSLAEAPLTWWRSLPPAALDLPAQRRLRAALLALPPLPLPGWESASQGDPAAAVRAAVTALAHTLVRPEHIEAAMSAVLLCAALGDPACADLLVHVLGRRARRRADLDALRLAHGWRRSGPRPPAPLAPGR
ncbi:hypothetical protein [Methylobacterium oxalidis]|uniref:Uncharacterized protein n=1 Tax=Methylobacterium oxalidis TaxID=944322 RepID=A0A512J5V2_9HYPH|nr:hypothetical protein [Methylobacterium oxalidis]GEP05303.1 hypothetical protein MOX02_33410 [Methylobacterium oxalidis]GJE30005.1 hypothetical protein LDDCCGHA_0168 [Methylobacterium oxalidis]GLS64653.1 hypothetical protein GCM10007888_30340 [Methylobacterium oxalidis]